MKSKKAIRAKGKSSLRHGVGGGEREKPTENLSETIIRKFLLTRFHIIHLLFCSLAPSEDQARSGRLLSSEHKRNLFSKTRSKAADTEETFSRFGEPWLAVPQHREIFNVRAAFDLNPLLIVLLNHSRNLWTTSVFKSWNSIVLSKAKKKLNKIFLYARFLFLAFFSGPGGGGGKCFMQGSQLRYFNKVNRSVNYETVFRCQWHMDV